MEETKALLRGAPLIMEENVSWKWISIINLNYYRISKQDVNGNNDCLWVVFGWISCGRDDLKCNVYVNDLNDCSWNVGE